MKRIFAIAAMLSAAFLAMPQGLAQEQGAGAQSLPVIEMSKHPQCGCCGAWAEHLRAEGFEVEVTETARMRGVKKLAGVPERLASCHTATVDGYVVEGHVPASDIKRLLAQRPAVKGIAVPGMPLGSPGMEADRTEAYDVLSFDAEGNTEVFQSHR